MRTSLRIPALSLLAIAAWQVQAAGFTPEVFRSDALTVHAGLSANSSQLVHLGEVLTLTVIVNHDPAMVSVAEIDAAFFTSAWSSMPAVRLTDWRQQRERLVGGRHLLSTEFDFQILGCPDDGAPTCPGERAYPVPGFEIGYEDLAVQADRSRTIRFTPWPQLLRVASTLHRDAEDQLYSFETYFPAGGYPEPTRVGDGTQTAAIVAGMALAVLTGGFLMWPFRRRGQDAPGAALPRWKQQLGRVREYENVDDARFVDAVRRCLVWYCNDELSIDPFVWLDLAEPGDDEPAENGAARNHADLRRLFFDLLHDPAGQGNELRSRLLAVTGQAGDGRT